MKKALKPIVSLSLASVLLIPTISAEPFAKETAKTEQSTKDDSIYIPKNIREGKTTEENDGFEDYKADTNAIFSAYAAKASYENVNNYIKKKKFSTAKIEQQLKSQFPKFGYRNGTDKPEGIVLHETANPTSTIQGEINYMSSNYNNAFVHAFVDKSHIIQIHPTKYAVWGAGQYANQRFIQFELVRHKTFDEFARSINNYAYYAAYLLRQYNMPFDSAESDGKGTVWTHNAVTKYLGGTNHTDPVGYFSQWGYSVSQLNTLIKEKYDAMKVYEKIKSDIVYTAYANVKDAKTYNIYSKPYNTSGAKKVSTLANYKSKQIRILRKAQTSRNWYQISVDGKTIGWVDTRAFSIYYKKGSSDKAVNLTRYLKKGQSGAYYYQLPVADPPIRTATLKTLTSKKITVYQQATVKNVLWYHIKDGSKVLGWTQASNLTANANTAEKYDTIHSDITYTAYATVKNATTYNIYSRPFNTSGAKKVSSLASYKSKKIRIHRKIVTDRSTWYQISVDGKTLGWTDSRAFSIFYKKAVTDKAASLTKKVAKKTDSYYLLPVDDNSIKKGTLSSYASKTLKIDRTATVQKVVWYHILDGSKAIGWVKASSLK